MTRSRLLTTLAAGTLGIALLGACSTESLTERAASFGLEQAIEGDQDIDLDFGENGGGFTIQTDEGDFAINFDEDEGGIFFDTPDGEGSINFDQDGIVFDTPDGEGTIEFQEDGLAFDTSEGDGTINFDESGLVVNTDSGEQAVFGATSAPQEWPAELGEPATLVPGTAVYSAFDFGAAGLTVSAFFQHDASEQYAQHAVDALTSTGWTVRYDTQADDTTYFDLERADGSLAQIAGYGDGTNVTFTFASSDG